MNNPPVENEIRGTAGSSEISGHPSAPAAEGGGNAHPADGRQEALVGPFGLRDTVVGASVLVMLVGSVLPFFTVTALGFDNDLNLWNGFSLFFIGIGILLPLLVAGLFIARRLSPGMKPRVGSLSLDQFASVAAVLALAFFFIETVTNFEIGSFLALIGSLGLVVSTTLAPHLPFFAREFRDRPEKAAAPVARDAQPLRARPARPKPENAKAAGGSNPPAPNDDAQPTVHGASDQRVTDDSAPGGTAVVGSTAAGTAAAGDVAVPATQAQATSAPATQAQAASPGQGHAPAAAVSGLRAEEPLAATTATPVVRNEGTGSPAVTDAGTEDSGDEPITATREESEAVVEAFWFAVGTPRQIVDERTGLPLFMFHPGDWELGLEDRGDEFLVQDKRTGRIGVLRDLTNIERVDAEQ